MEGAAQFFLLNLVLYQRPLWKVVPCATEVAIHGSQQNKNLQNILPSANFNSSSPYHLQQRSTPVLLVVTVVASMRRQGQPIAKKIAQLCYIRL